MHPSASQYVVLIHCSAGSPRQWSSLIADLNGFETLAPGLIGHAGQSRWHGAGALRLAEEAEAIADACPAGVPFHLVGHSYGGAVALRLALSFSARVSSLTLIEPTSFHILKGCDPDEGGLLDEVRAVADAVNRGVIGGDYRSGMATFIDYWSHTGCWAQLSDLHQERLGSLALHVAHHFEALFEDRATLADYASVAAPTLVLSGMRSPRPSRTISRLLAETLPHAQHRVIRGAGHMSPLTHAAAVNPIIVKHVRAHAWHTVASGTSDNVTAAQTDPAHAA